MLCKRVNSITVSSAFQYKLRKKSRYKWKRVRLAHPKVLKKHQPPRGTLASSTKHRYLGHMELLFANISILFNLAAYVEKLELLINLWCQNWKSCLKARNRANLYKSYKNNYLKINLLDLDRFVRFLRDSALNMIHIQTNGK